MTPLADAILRLLTHLGSLTVLAGILGVVATKLGEHFIAKRFKAYESELGVAERTHKATLDRDLELHRSALSLEHVKHSRVHERLLDVMLELNRRVLKLDRAMREATELLIWNSEETYEEFRKRVTSEAAAAYLEVDRYFDDNRILLSEETCHMVAVLCHAYSEARVEGLQADLMHARGRDEEQAHALDKQAWERVRTHIPPLRRELEREFRRQLGVTVREDARAVPAESAAEPEEA